MVERTICKWLVKAGMWCCSAAELQLCSTGEKQYLQSLLSWASIRMLLLSVSIQHEQHGV